MSVVQLLSEFACRASLGQVKALNLGIVGAATCELALCASLVTYSSDSDVTTLQVVNRQDVVIVLDDGNAASGELALEHLGPL